MKATSGGGNSYDFKLGRTKAGKYVVYTNDNRVNVQYGPFDTQEHAATAREAIVKYMNKTGKFHPVRDGNKWYESAS